MSIENLLQRHYELSVLADVEGEDASRRLAEVQEDILDLVRSRDREIVAHLTGELINKGVFLGARDIYAYVRAARTILQAVDATADKAAEAIHEHNILQTSRRLAYVAGAERAATYFGRPDNTSSMLVALQTEALRQFPDAAPTTDPKEPT